MSSLLKDLGLTLEDLRIVAEAIKRFRTNIEDLRIVAEAIKRFRTNIRRFKNSCRS